MTGSRRRRRQPRPRSRVETPARPERSSLRKAPTGISGLDEITSGGLPRRRATLVCGGPGSGKTLLATQFLAHGALVHGEPGVFMSFDESPEDLIENSRSIGVDLKALSARRQVLLDYVYLDRNEIVESGGYDLDGLFIRLGHAIETIGAKRVVLDTIEMLFSGMSDAFALRAELHRLFQWLKAKGVTTIVTGERVGDGLTRHGLEEYLTDCVILLDQRVTERQATRRLRILKYRGSAHGNNEFPFLIDDLGLSVVPITSLRLDYKVSTEHVSTGVGGLDEMFGNEGYFRGDSVLVSGTAGTGKSSLAAHFADAACGRGDLCLYFSFEEPRDQITRNMRSIGIDLETWLRRGLLRVHAQRPTAHGLETHLVTMHGLIDRWRPNVVVVDPITSLVAVGTELEVKLMLARLIDFMKSRQITVLFTSLTDASGVAEQTDVGISSLMDVWILLGNLEANGERNRGLQIVKARGAEHSNQVRGLAFTDHGLTLVGIQGDPPGRLGLGSARSAPQ